MRNILLVLSEFIATLEIGRSTPWDLAAKLREQIQRIDENMMQAEAALPGLGDSLMRSLGVNEDSSNTEALPEPPTTAPAPNPAPARVLPVPNRMISIDAGLGSQPAPLPPPPAPLPPADEPMALDSLSALQEPPHDALSALQLGQDPSSSSFNALGFAASQGMFDYGVAPMDDALIGELLRYWPAQGVLADAVPEGSPFTGPGM